MSANDTSRYRWLGPEILFIQHAIDASVPVLGICLGAQLIARARGAAPQWSGFLIALPARATVMHWHGETFDLAEGATRLASSPACANQGFLFGSHIAALQFHLESTTESIVNLTRMSGDDIEHGTYQVRRVGAEATMRAGVLEHRGGTRAILSGLLEHLEREALGRR